MQHHQSMLGEQCHCPVPQGQPWPVAVCRAQSGSLESAIATPCPERVWGAGMRVDVSGDAQCPSRGEELGWVPGTPRDSQTSLCPSLHCLPGGPWLCQCVQPVLPHHSPLPAHPSVSFVVRQLLQGSRVLQP